MLPGNDKKSYYPMRRKQLRERFRKTSFTGFSAHEALELLLTYAIPRRNVKPIVMELLGKFGEFTAVLEASFEDLCTIHGLGENAATFITLLRPCAALYLKLGLAKKRTISSTMDLIEYCMMEMKGLKDEQFRAIFLNSQNELLADEIIQEGTVDHAVVYPRKVMERALRYRATGMIFVHNHPGGGLKPSREDIILTQSLIQAASTLRLEVHDHLIISSRGYYSFRKNGLQ